MYHQPPPPDPVYHQPPPPPPGGGGAIALTLKYSPLAFMLGLFKPEMQLNGHPMPLAWGRSVVPVPAGQHHLHVHVPYLLPSRIGSADLPVSVYPGQTVELEYRAPMIAFLGGSLGPAPQKYRGMAATVAILVVTLLLLLCGCGGVILAAIGSSAGDTAARPLTPDRPLRPTATVPGLDPLPFPTPTATGTAEPGTDKPTLRPVAARSIVGPAFSAGADTYTMDFVGWPFAFRTPGSWGCLAGKIALPDAKAWVCIDEGNPRSGERVSVMLRPCPAPCGSVQQTALDKAFFDAGATSRRHDGRTRYVETVRDSRDRYLLDVSHYFAAEPGGPVQWQVGVGAIAPMGNRTDVQRVANDIFSQTS